MDYSAKSARSNLTGSQVLDIRRQHDQDGMNDAALARLYSVTRKTIYDIEQRRTWKSVPAPTSVRGYKGYEVYPDGRVRSAVTGKFIAQAKRRTGPVVQIRTSGGKRKVVAISNLLSAAFG